MSTFLLRPSDRLRNIVIVKRYCVRLCVCVCVCVCVPVCMYVYVCLLAYVKNNMFKLRNSIIEILSKTKLCVESENEPWALIDGALFAR